METRDVTFNLTEEQINAIKVLIGDACDIEQKKEEDKTSFPKYSSKYYFINEDNEAWESSWYDDEIDRERLSLGNCFETREEAKFEVERLKVLHEMKQFAEPKDYTWNEYNSHYYIYYRVTNNAVEIGQLIFCKSDEIYFKSVEDARDCIKAIGIDRIKKYYLRIEG